MSRLSPDSSIHQVLSWIAALIVANLIALAWSIPVVTSGIGLLVCAVVSMRLIRDESTALVPAMRQTMRGAVAAGVAGTAELIVGALVVWEWVASQSLSSPFLILAVRSLLLFVAVMLGIVHVWLWPMMAYRLAYHGSLRVGDLVMLARSSLLVGVATLGRTFGALIVSAAPLAVVMVSVEWAVRMGFWYLVFGIAFAMYVCVLAAHPVLASVQSLDEADPSLSGE